MRQARSPALDRTSSRCWQPQCSWRGAVVVHSSRHHHRTLPPVASSQRQQHAAAAHPPARPRAAPPANSRPSPAQPSAGPAAAPQCKPAVPSAATAFLLAQLAAAGPVAAATVCIDVPDWLADWRLTLLHSPVLAVGVAAGALLLFPKLIRGAINYLALPAIVALLAYGAVSFPEQTASTVYSVLAFVREHPAASSAGIVVAAGALLGPDLLAGAAVAGAVLLLSVQLGFVQLPKLSALPALPGQRLLAQQLDKTGKALRDKLDVLDGDDDDKESSQQASSSSSIGWSSRRDPPPPAAPTDAAMLRSRSVQQLPPALASPGSGGGDVSAVLQQLGAGAKALGDGVLQQGRQLQQSGTVQDASGKAAGAAKAAASRLLQQGQELASSEAVQALRQSAAAAGKAVSGLQSAAARRAEPHPSPAPAQRDVDAGIT